MVNCSQDFLKNIKSLHNNSVKKDQNSARLNISLATWGGSKHNPPAPSLSTSIQTIRWAVGRLLRVRRWGSPPSSNLRALPSP